MIDEAKLFARQDQIRFEDRSLTCYNERRIYVHMPILIGIVLGLLVGVSTTLAGMHRDRALYPAIMIVIASYFSLFAVMGGMTETIVLETVVALVFAAAAIAGFKTSLWLVAAAILAHGLTDPFHGRLIQNAGVPAWWPAFCASIDVVLAAYLAWLLYTKRVPALRL